MLYRMGAVASIMVALPHLQKMTFSMAEFLSEGQNEKKKKKKEIPRFSVMFTWIWYSVVLICFSILLSRVWSLIHCCLHLAGESFHVVQFPGLFNKVQ